MPLHLGNVKKKGVKLIASLLCVGGVASSMVSNAFAANGSLTFWHGNHPNLKSTYAQTVSTKDEYNMYFAGTTNITAGKHKGVTQHYSDVDYYIATAIWDINVDGSRGSSLFTYYVNHSIVHTSTDWFNFDYT